jgi:hypothetical protein
MKSLAVREARTELAELLGPASNQELDYLIDRLNGVDALLSMLVEEARGRAVCNVVRGVALTAFEPRCLTATLRLGDLSVHLAILPPRYFRGVDDDLWRVSAEAYLACGHERHDIDPVIDVGTRTAENAQIAVEHAVAVAEALRVAVGAWNLDAEYWHAQMNDP